jgi:dihydrofolate reductase
MVRPFNIIVACSENRVIGRGGRLPWRIPEDWQYFRKTTAGATVVLGRISFESWRSVLEDDRHAVVLTRNQNLAGERVEVARSLREALVLASAASRPIFVCGGQRIFEEAIERPEAERLYLTQVHAHVEGDRSFPDWRRVFTKVITSRDGADDNYRYTFSVLERGA